MKPTQRVPLDASGPSGPPAAAAMTGRAGELAWMAKALARAGRHAPATLLIGGEAGAGKSRLVSEFARFSPDGGGAPLVLAGQCLELGAVGLPFGPFSAILAQVTTARGGISGDLARLLPGASRGPGAGRDPGDVARELAGDDRQEAATARLRAQLTSLLRGLADRGPVVLVIEDAQWADESSRSLLGFLVGQALGGVLTIVTYRTDELHRGHPLRPLLGKLGRLSWVAQADLAGLSRDESGELIARILGRQPDPRLIDRVYRRSQGNPLFIEELLRAGDPHGKRGPARPGSLRDLLLARVCGLPEQTQDVLRAASVGGQRTGLPLLAAVTGMAPGALIAALRPAGQAGLLLAGSGSCTFRHALTSEVIHQDLLPGDHTRLHHRFALALEADPALGMPGWAALERAQHWHHAHDPAGALSSAWRAAAEAGQLLAYPERLAMLGRVLELWRCVPDAPRRTGTDQSGVLERAAAAAEAAGESEMGVAFATAALEQSDAGSEPGRTARLLSRRDRLRARSHQPEAPRHPVRPEPPALA